MNTVKQMVGIAPVERVIPSLAMFFRRLSLFLALMKPLGCT